MKIISRTLVAAVVIGTFSSCGLYNKYESKAVVPTDAYGTGDNIAAAAANTSMAALSWRDFFTDPLLQALIDTALVRNADINGARIAVEQSQVSLSAARMAYLPSLNFNPSGALSRFGNGNLSKTYNLPLQLNVPIDLFGSLTNQKRMSAALVEQRKAEEDAVRANIISNVAQQYNLLQSLDCQLDILLSTEQLWAASLETQKALMENGKAYSTAVNQMAASYINVKTQIVDIRHQIHSVQNSICNLLSISPQAIKRSKWGTYSVPSLIATGVPAEMLAYRPDVKAAERAMEVAFYNVNAARSAFYPSLSLTGEAGWTNNAGVVVNPGKMLLNAVASLTQPIFARGKISANFKSSKLTQEDVANHYAQTVVNAGNQVNEAIAGCNAAKEKDVLLKEQVKVLHDAYDGTHELMNNGKASYLEVLTAQEALLQAQLGEAMNLYKGSQAAIALYIALGGATK